MMIMMMRKMRTIEKKVYRDTRYENVGNQAPGKEGKQMQ